MKTLLISRTLPEKVLADAHARYEVTVRATDDPMEEKEVTDTLNSYDAVLPTLRDKFTAAAISASTPRAKLIANFGVGFNHIDIEAAKAKGIAVTNTPGAVTDATADIAMMLILMTARRAGEGERLVRAHKWTGWQPTQMLGNHVSGKTVGIVGMGRIGQAIANRCRLGFGCEIVFANRSQKSIEGAKQLASPVDVARSSDFVVASTPGGADTQHLFDATFFNAMQPHGIFVNISRGEVVDEAAMVKALQDRKFAGAGLDVYEFEPTISDALYNLENVTLLPHLGTATLEVRENMGQMAMANVHAFFDGEALPNPV